MNRDGTKGGSTQADVGAAATISEAPRDEVEQRLIEMWRWILDIPDIGVRDNFYDLVAAHYKDNRLIDHSSRRSLTLFTTIEEEFGKLLPMAALMQAPTAEQLRSSGVHETDTLLGLYEGVPITARENYGFVLPDKITIFQRSIEGICETREEVIEEVRETVIHEVAHHFGIDDAALHEMGL